MGLYGYSAHLVSSGPSGDLGTATATVALSTSASLTTAISMVASAAVALTTVAVLTTAISMAASATVAFTTAADLTTAISLAASATVAFTTAADLTTAISLAATATIAFTTAGTLSPAGNGDLGTATATVAFTAAAVLTTAISMAASATVAFTSAAALTAGPGGPAVVVGRHFNPVRARSTQELLTYFERLQNGTLQFRRLDVVGPVRTAVRTITSSETMLETDRTILADAAGGAITVTLPALKDILGVELVVKRLNAGANAVTVQGQTGQLIDGGTVTLAAQWDLVRVQAGVDGWFRV